MKETIEAFWRDNQRLVCLMTAAFLFFIAHPGRSNALYQLAFLVALSGELIRVWVRGFPLEGALSKEGPYALCRHPRQFGSFLMMLAFAAASSSFSHWLSTLFIWGVTYAAYRVFFLARVRADDAELRARFGQEFEAYAAEIPMFWPDLKRWEAARETTRWRFDLFASSSELRTIGVFWLVTFFLRFKMTYRL
ncbi:MAG: hypothetical protein HY078_04660 [Elusimicrobia bacterium]|nr:hypothetical protein [Elusimicrobiota bacterium]